MSAGKLANPVASVGLFAAIALFYVIESSIFGGAAVGSDAP